MSMKNHVNVCPLIKDHLEEFLLTNALTKLSNLRKDNIK